MGLSRLQAWFEKQKDCLLQKLCFQSSRVDPFLSFKRSAVGCVFLLVYIDDIIITSDSSSALNEVVHCLNQHFSLKDLGELGYFLGLEIACN